MIFSSGKWFAVSSLPFSLLSSFSMGGTTGGDYIAPKGLDKAGVPRRGGGGGGGGGGGLAPWRSLKWRIIRLISVVEEAQSWSVSAWIIPQECLDSLFITSFSACDAAHRVTSFTTLRFWGFFCRFTELRTLTRCHGPRRLLVSQIRRAE